MKKAPKGLSLRPIGQSAEDERRQLAEEMKQVRAELDKTYAEFNSHGDPDLIDSCLSTINALRSRQSDITRRMRCLDEEKK